MMKQCMQCLFYDKEADEFKRGCDDCIFVDPNDPRHGEHHYCGRYDEPEYGIPRPIMNDEVKCKGFYSREEHKRIEAEIERRKK